MGKTQPHKHTYYSPEVVEYIEQAVSKIKEPDKKGPGFIEGDAEYSANDLLSEMVNRTPIGLRFYEAAKKVMNFTMKDGGAYIIEGRAELLREKVSPDDLQRIEDKGALYPAEHPLGFKTSYRFTADSTDGLLHEDTIVSILDGNTAVIGRYPASQLKIGQCRIAGLSYS